jgi:hypothetical protein
MTNWAFDLENAHFLSRLALLGDRGC